MFKGESGMDINKSVRGIIIGGLSSVAACAALYLIAAFIITKSGQIPLGVISTLTTILSGLSCFIGGFISGKIVKKSGILTGAAAGFTLLLIQLIYSLISESLNPSVLLIIKSAVLLLSGAIGGIIGVNKGSAKIKFK